MKADENRAKPLAGVGSPESDWVPENEAIPFVRWSARVFGLIVAGFSLFMFVGETFFETRLPRPPRAFPIIPMAIFGGYAIGMFLALKWERAGAMLAGVSAAVLFLGIWSSSGRNPNSPPELAALLFIIFGLAYFGPVVLYILCWWLEDRDRKRWRAGS